jgi:hypothetical protein
MILDASPSTLRDILASSGVTFEGSTMRERRSAPRYPANRTILLRWENGEEARARLENISQGGAAIRIESPPPGSGTVLVCIDDAPQQPGAQATILKVTRARGWFRKPSYRIQVKFIKACPYDLFSGVISDFIAVTPTPLEPDYESYWR